MGKNKLKYNKETRPKKRSVVLREAREARLGIAPKRPRPEDVKPLKPSKLAKMAAKAERKAIRSAEVYEDIHKPSVTGHKHLTEETEDQEFLGELDQEPYEEMDEEQGEGETASTVPNPVKASAQAEGTVDWKSQRKHHDLIQESKRLLNRVHAADKSGDKFKRAAAVEDLLRVTKGHMVDIIFKHDASRIIQGILKWGYKEHRDAVAQELDEAKRWRDLCESKYTKFLVSKILRYCPNFRQPILKAILSDVPKMIHRKCAQDVVEELYATYSNAEMRLRMISTFWGKEFVLFEDKPQRLAETLKTVDQAKAQLIMANIRNHLQGIMDQTDRGAITLSITHKLLLEYLLVLDQYSGDPDKVRRELVEGLLEVLPEIVHTKDGSRAFRLFVVHGSAKDRKGLVRCLKPHMLATAKDDQAHYCLFTIFDCVDDTKFVMSTLFGDLTKHMLHLLQEKYGRRVISYLIAARESRELTPDTVSVIARMDDIRKNTSKKDDAIRYAELSEGINATLQELVQEKARELATDERTCFILTEMLLHLKDVSDATLKACWEVFNDLNPKELPPFTVRAYRTVLSGGWFNTKELKVQPINQPLADRFAAMFWQVCGEERLKVLACSDATFVVIEVLKRSPDQLAALKKESMIAEVEKVKAKGSVTLVTYLKTGKDSV